MGQQNLHTYNLQKEVGSSYDRICLQTEQLVVRLIEIIKENFYKWHSLTQNSFVCDLVSSFLFVLVFFSFCSFFFNSAAIFLFINFSKLRTLTLFTMKLKESCTPRRNKSLHTGKGISHHTERKLNRRLI